MIYTKFVTSNTTENSAYKRALSELRKIAFKETDKSYLVAGVSTNGNDVKMLKQQGVIKKSGKKRIWIVEENDKTIFFKWAGEHENVTLFDVCDESNESDKPKDETSELKKDEQKQDGRLLQTRSSAYVQAPNPLVIEAAPNFDDYPYTKYEKARIISARALQISAGSPMFVEPNGTIDSAEIAEMELDRGVCPITVRRKTTLALDAKTRKTEELLESLKNR